jgi:hypothetical protein
LVFNIHAANKNRVRYGAFQERVGRWNHYRPAKEGVIASTRVGGEKREVLLLSVVRQVFILYIQRAFNTTYSQPVL